MKYFYTLLLLFLFPVIAFSAVLPDKIYATSPVALDKHLKPNHIVDLDVLKLGSMSQEMELEHGEAITVKVTEYVPPKRGKRDGYYKVIFNYKNNGIMQGKMAVAKKADIKDISKKAGATIAGHALGVTMLPQAYAVTKGLVKPNENQSRIQSAGTNLYNSTPLTYTEKGHDFSLPAGGVVVLSLKNSNYSFDSETEE